MIATTLDLLNRVIGINGRQFVIPIYQRKYKWGKEQCQRLVDDMLKAGTKGKKHFTGAIVYQQMPGGYPQKAYVVDGQQRLTTVLLIVKALSLLSNAEKGEDKDYSYIWDVTKGLIYADEHDSEMGWKIEPSKNDREAFIAIMSAKSIEELERNPLIANHRDELLYCNFRDIYAKIQSALKEGKDIRHDIYGGLLNLQIVEMSLEANDDPQEIFESINSLGVKLSNSDLIRNYLLMSNSDQKSLFEKYWEPMQDSLIGEDQMEDFVDNYLLMKKRFAINYDDIYKEYVSYSNSLYPTGDIDKGELIKDLFGVANVYRPFLRNTSDYSPDTNMLMQELRDMGQSTAYPFLLRVFLDEKNGLIDEKTLDKVINLIIVYLVRRTICQVPTNSLRGLMLNLYSRIFKIEENKKRYYESIYAFLTSLQTNDAMPSEEAVLERLKLAPIYRNVKFTTYLLFKIENGRYPHPYSEFSSTNSPSVEHIMPQTLTPDWEKMLGSDYENTYQTYVNTLGNLSLSSRPKNSIMGNESFEIKKKILQNNGSKFTVLNKDVIGWDKFALDEIKQREERLGGIVVSEYMLQKVDVKGIRFEENEAFFGSLEALNVYKGATPIAFSILGDEKPVESYARIITLVAKELYRRYPEKMRELASENYNPWDSGQTPCLHYEIDGINDADVADGIQVHTNFNAQYCVQFCCLMMKECGVEPEQLVIYLKKDTINSENKFSKSQRIKAVRGALQSMADEGLIVYDPANMPKSDDYIKFSSKELKETFPCNGPATLWDKEKFQEVSYFEYQLSRHELLVTVKNYQRTAGLIRELQSLADDFDFEKPDVNGLWHIYRKGIDFAVVADANDKVSEVKKQLEPIIEELNGKLLSIRRAMEQDGFDQSQYDGKENSGYVTEERFLELKKPSEQALKLYRMLCEEIKKAYPDAERYFTTKYVAWKSKQVFVDARPRGDCLQLTTKDVGQVSPIGHRLPDNYKWSMMFQSVVKSEEEIPEAMKLIKLSYDKANEQLL